MSISLFLFLHFYNINVVILRVSFLIDLLLIEKRLTHLLLLTLTCTLRLLLSLNRWELGLNLVSHSRLHHHRLPSSLLLHLLLLLLHHLHLLLLHGSHLLRVKLVLVDLHRQVVGAEQNVNVVGVEHCLQLRRKVFGVHLGAQWQCFHEEHAVLKFVKVFPGRLVPSNFDCLSVGGGDKSTVGNNGDRNACAGVNKESDGTILARVLDLERGLDSLLVWIENQLRGWLNIDEVGANVESRHECEVRAVLGVFRVGRIGVIISPVGVDHLLIGLHHLLNLVSQLVHDVCLLVLVGVICHILYYSKLIL